MKKVKRMMFGGVSKALGNAAKKVAAKAPAPAPTPVRSGFSSIRAGEARSMANRNQPAPTPVNKNQASMSQLQAGANAIRGLQQGSPQQSSGSGSIFNRRGAPTPTPPSMASKISGLGLKRPGIGMKKGGKVSSASSRGDGCAVKGKTKGKMV